MNRELLEERIAILEARGVSRVEITDLAPRKQTVAASQMRRRRNVRMKDLQGKPLGLKIGQMVKWRGKSWVFYDVDADSRAPRGVTLVLLAKDYGQMARNVSLADIDH